MAISRHARCTVFFDAEMLERQKSAARCPCLYSAEVHMCRADPEAIHVPWAQHLARFCLTKNYRRCKIFHAFLQALPQRTRRGSRAVGDGPTAAVGRRIGNR